MTPERGAEILEEYNAGYEKAYKCIPELLRALEASETEAYRLSVVASRYKADFEAAEARIAKLEAALEKIATGRTGFFGANLIPSSTVAREALVKP